MEKTFLYVFPTFRTTILGKRGNFKGNIPSSKSLLRKVYSFGLDYEIQELMD